MIATPACSMPTVSFPSSWRRFGVVVSLYALSSAVTPVLVYHVYPVPFQVVVRLIFVSCMRTMSSLFCFAQHSASFVAPGALRPRAFHVAIRRVLPYFSALVVWGRRGGSWGTPRLRGGPVPLRLFFRPVLRLSFLCHALMKVAHSLRRPRLVFLGFVFRALSVAPLCLRRVLRPAADPPPRVTG